MAFLISIPFFVLCLIGLGITVMGVRKWYRSWKLMKRCTKPIEGIITGIKKRENPDSQKRELSLSKTHNPEYKISVAGVEYSREAQYPKSESYAQSMIGLKVMVYYNVNDPNESFLIFEKTAEYTAMFITAVGIVVMLFSYSIFFKYL